jgi:hypothetical protein
MAWHLDRVDRRLTSMAPEERLTPEVVSAIAACVTAFLALVALIATVPQYRQAKRDGAAQIEEQRRLAREQARPYVAVTMQFADVAPAHLVHFVIRNYGRTSARNVQVVSEPALRRAGDLPGATAEVFIPESFPTLVPGQSWATFWDMGPSRRESTLPDRHDVVVTYTDDMGTPYQDRYVLDWAVLWKQRQNPPKTMHDAATALVKLQETMRSWSEDGRHGLRVWHRDGHRKDVDDRQHIVDVEAQVRQAAEQRRAAGVQRPDLDAIATDMDERPPAG